MPKNGKNVEKRSRLGQKKPSEEQKGQEKILPSRRVTRSQASSSHLKSSTPSLVAEEMPAVEKGKLLHIKVAYESKIATFEYNEKEKLNGLFLAVGDYFNLNPAEIRLCLKKVPISVNDSPKNLGISELDELKCTVVSDVSTHDMQPSDEEYDFSKIKNLNFDDDSSDSDIIILD